MSRRSHTSTGSGRKSLLPLRVKNDVPGASTTSRKSTGYIKSGAGTRNSTGRSSTGANRFAPPNKKRKSSVSNRFGQSHSIVKDPRPNTDKAYKEQSIRTIYEFLMENGYPHPISIKKLHTPMTNDFFKIFEFLYSFIQPNFKMGKLEEDAPRIFNLLGYPFPVSKNSMFAIGTPHTWPTILAALRWLLEIVKYSCEMNIDDVLFPVCDDFETVPESKGVYEYVDSTYREFLAGADTFAEQDNLLVEQLNQNICGNSGGIEQLVSANSKYLSELGELESQPDKLSELTTSTEAAQNDIQKFEAYLLQLETHKKKLETARKDTMDEKGELESEHKVVSDRQKELTSVFERQDLAPGELERIIRMRQQLQGQQDSLNKEIESIDKRIWEEEISIGKSQERTEAKCAEYNKLAQQMKLIPATAENAHGVNYEIRCDYIGTNHTPVDFVGSIKPSLMQMKKQCNQNVHDLMGLKITELDSLEQISEMVRDRAENTNMLETKHNRVEEELACNKESMQREYQKLKANADAIQEDIASMRKLSQLAEDEDGLIEAKIAKEKRQHDMKREEEAYGDFLKEAMTLVIDHKMTFETHVRSLKEKAEQEYEKLLNESNAV